LKKKKKKPSENGANSLDNSLQMNKSTMQATVACQATTAMGNLTISAVLSTRPLLRHRRHCHRRHADVVDDVVVVDDVDVVRVDVLDVDYCSHSHDRRHSACFADLSTLSHRENSSMSF
jgi:hypothetical protein